MYRVCYNRLEVNVDIVQSDVRSTPRVEMGTTCDARVKYVDSPCAVGSYFQSKPVNGKLTVCTILTCCLEEHTTKRVRFSDYNTDQVSELKAQIAKLELANAKLSRMIEGYTRRAAAGPSLSKTTSHASER